MSVAHWIIALEIGLGLVILGWFGLQVAILNSRIMNAVVGHQTELLKIVERSNHLIATLRIGDTPDPLPPPGPYHHEAWTPPDRAVGSS